MEGEVPTEEFEWTQASADVTLGFCAYLIPPV